MASALPTHWQHETDYLVNLLFHNETSLLISLLDTDNVMNYFCPKTVSKLEFPIEEIAVLA